MDWFQKLTGFAEISPEQVRAKLTVDGDVLTSLMNGARYTCGKLETPSLGELRSRVEKIPKGPHCLTFRPIVADVRDLHASAGNANALFQVASQFNLLEMVSPNVTPEMGVGIYENDPTQGPACAISAGAGTIFRNYFAPVNGATGQTAFDQIDCLRDLGVHLGNDDGRLWKMSNGYALATREGLHEISYRLRAAGEDELDRLRELLRIGIQWSTEVTRDGTGHLVSQAFCSALPVGYSTHPPESWEPFARLVLEAAYEAVLCAAVLNSGSSNRVYLTLLGGGVFKNRIDWIVDAIERAVGLFASWDLDVRLVCRGSIPEHIQKIAARS